MARQKELTYITENKPFSKRLRELMFDEKASQTELAAFVKCTRQAISLYAAGQSTPDIDILLKIAQYFHVSTDYLLGLTDVKTPDIEIKAICEYTGLSENAVEVIKEYNISNKKVEQIDEERCDFVVDDSGRIDILNQLLTHRTKQRLDFGSVINCVKDYLNSVNQEIQNSNKAELLENEEDVPTLARLAVENLKLRNETEPLALWKIQKYMVSLVESLGEEISKEVMRNGKSAPRVTS